MFFDAKNDPPKKFLFEVLLQLGPAKFTRMGFAFFSIVFGFVEKAWFLFIFCWSVNALASETKF